MSSLISRSAKTARSLFLAAKGSRLVHEGNAASIAALRSRLPYLSTFRHKVIPEDTTQWASMIFAIPAAIYMILDKEAYAAEMERTFIAIKPDGVQRGLISEIISRFERKGFKLVGIKMVAPSKEFAQKHYHDLSDRPFFDGLCNFLSSGPVLAMVWEGEGVVKYGRKLIGATDPQNSEPGTIRGDLAVVMGRNIIHGSDGLDTAKYEIDLWFQQEEMVDYTGNDEKWIYGVN